MCHDPVPAHHAASPLPPRPTRGPVGLHKQALGKSGTVRQRTALAVTQRPVTTLAPGSPPPRHGVGGVNAGGLLGVCESA